MGKTIMMGVAALLLSAGVAVAQSNSDQNSMGATAKMGAQSGSSTDTAGAAKPAKKTAHVASRYPKAEAKLNSEEAQVTKQLNEQESQQVVSSSQSGGASQPQ